MSKHSKWAKVKNQKLAADVKKGAVFTKHVRAISIAARDGVDPAKNFKLRMAMDLAKTAGVPKDTIDRALERAAGLGEEELFEALYEAHAPGNVSLMIGSVTNNKNRAVGDLRRLLEKHGATLAQSGSLGWQFNRLGVIRLAGSKDEELELKLIDLGVEDLKEEEGGLMLYVKPELFQKTLVSLAGLNLAPEYHALEWVAKSPVSVDDPALREKLDALYEALDEADDVQNYFSNEV